MHLCHAKGCKRDIPPAWFMCGKHWFMVPRKMQNKIWKHYRPGQEIDKEVTDKYLKWAQRAIDKVAEKEGV